MERFQHFLNFIKPSDNFYEKYFPNSCWCFQVYWISRENMVSVNLQFKVKFFTEIIYGFGLVCKTSATFIVYYFEPKRSWSEIVDLSTAWKVSKYGVISGPYFPAFGLNTEIYGVISVFSPDTGKYGPKITPYLDTFHIVETINLVDLTFEAHFLFGSVAGEMLDNVKMIT